MSRQGVLAKGSLLADWPRTFFSLGCAEALRKLTPECALPLAALPAAAKPAAQADVAEDDADRGALAAQSEATATLSRVAVRRNDLRQEPGAVVPHAGICAGGGEQSPSLPRQLIFQWLTNPQSGVDIA